MNEVLDLPSIVAPEAVADLLAHHEPVTILDVRTPAEFASAHISGSFNVPLDLLPEHASAIRTATGEPVILVCRSGTRAHLAEQALRIAQLPRLHVLAGGLTAWESANLPLNRGRQRWSLERQVRGLAGMLVLAGAAGGMLVWPPLGLLAAGVGAGLAFSALSDTCGLALLLARLPYNRGASCDVGAVLGEMASRGQSTATRQVPSPARHSRVQQESWS